MFSQGCVYNFCLLAGVKVLPIGVEDFFIDLYYFLNKSVNQIGIEII